MCPALFVCCCFFHRRCIFIGVNKFLGDVELETLVDAVADVMRSTCPAGKFLPVCDMTSATPRDDEPFSG